MLITRATDYAVRILAALLNAPGRRLKTAELVDATSVPKDYAPKVIKVLARRGWVEARRGIGGGFALLPQGQNLTLLDVVQAFEGPVRMHVCTGPSGCQFLSRCPVHNVWLETEERVRAFLGEQRIAELAAESRERLLFVPVPSKLLTTISGAP